MNYHKIPYPYWPQDDSGLQPYRKNWPDEPSTPAESRLIRTP